MDVEFDPAKDAINFRKHGLSLAQFEGFDDVAAVVVDDRFDYGEVRLRAFGRIAGQGYCLVFTPTTLGLRAISFRRAHDKEMRRYE